MILRGAEHECGQCHVVFHGLEQFDRHQDRDYEREPVIICRSPQELGLVQSERGCWYTSEGLQNALRTTGQLIKARSERAS